MCEAARDLTQERLLAFLKTRALGRSTRLLREATSTSDIAREDGLSGAPHGHLVHAERQSQGRGRKGRSWVSPPGVNLAFSLLLRPALAIEEAPLITLATALGCRDALEEIGVQAAIKWPNDLLIGARKVAGILSEMSLAGRAIGHVVVGVGLNVNLDTEALEPPLNETATSLRRELGRPLDRARVLACLLDHLETTLGELETAGFDSLRERYRRHSATLGQRVRAFTESGIVEGVATDLGGRGSLFLRLDSGETREIFAGDVERVRGLS